MSRRFSYRTGTCAVLLLAGSLLSACHSPSASPSAAADPSLTQSAGPWGINVAQTGSASPSVVPSDSHVAVATVLGRDASGQFRLHATVNGRDAEFLVDTGADLVSLSQDEADRLGLNVSPGDYRPMLRTASGTANGARVKLDRLVVSGQVLHDVEAVVVEGLGVNLLGQSALRQMGRVELQGDHMVIRPV